MSLLWLMGNLQITRVNKKQQQQQKFLSLYIANYIRIYEQHFLQINPIIQNNFR